MGRFPTPFRGLTQDVRIGLRQLWATPIVTAVAILSLALGIGANTALFSLANSLLLRPLPVNEPHRLVMISDTGTPGPRYWDVPVPTRSACRSSLDESLLKAIGWVPSWWRS